MSAEMENAVPPPPPPQGPPGSIDTVGWPDVIPGVRTRTQVEIDEALRTGARPKEPRKLPQSAASFPDDENIIPLSTDRLKKIPTVAEEEDEVNEVLTGLEDLFKTSAEDKKLAASPIFSTNVADVADIPESAAASLAAEALVTSKRTVMQKFYDRTGIKPSSSVYQTENIIKKLPMTEADVDDLAEMVANDYAVQALNPHVTMSQLEETFRVAVSLEMRRKTGAYPKTFLKRHKKAVVGTTTILTSAGVLTGLGVKLNDVAAGRHLPRHLPTLEADGGAAASGRRAQVPGGSSSNNDGDTVGLNTNITIEMTFYDPSLISDPQFPIYINKRPGTLPPPIIINGKNSTNKNSSTDIDNNNKNATDDDIDEDDDGSQSQLFAQACCEKRIRKRSRRGPDGLTDYDDIEEYMHCESCLTLFPHQRKARDLENWNDGNDDDKDFLYKRHGAAVANIWNKIWYDCDVANELGLLDVINVMIEGANGKADEDNSNSFVLTEFDIYVKSHCEAGFETDSNGTLTRDALSLRHLNQQLFEFDGGLPNEVLGNIIRIQPDNLMEMASERASKNILNNAFKMATRKVTNFVERHGKYHLPYHHR